jgi:ribosomal protein S17E
MTNMEADALLQQGEENFQKAKQEYEENKKKAEELIKQNERLQKELKDKEAAEKKAQIEKDKAERKLKTASDKVKLIDFASKISLLHSSIPQVSSNEAKEIVNQVDSYFTKLLEYVKKQSENLDK